MGLGLILSEFFWGVEGGKEADGNKQWDFFAE